jgi:hypothetical protein
MNNNRIFKKIYGIKFKMLMSLLKTYYHVHEFKLLRRKMLKIDASTFNEFKQFILTLV